MHFPKEYLVLYFPIAAVTVWQYFRDTNAHLVKVEYPPALESSKLLKEWCTWLATLTTAAIGASAYLEKASPMLANLAVAAFASSLACTATLLLSLPSLVSRLSATKSSKNDVYELTAFLWAPKVFAPALRIGCLAFAQYYFFLFGIASFAINATRPR
jgi:hypothetical protein